MLSEAQKRADRKYKREKTCQMCLRFYPAEAKMWAFLSTQKNKQGFLKKLISREMEAMATSNVAVFCPVGPCEAKSDESAFDGESGKVERVD